MSQIEEDPQASNDGMSNDYEDSSNEPQAKRFRPDYEESNDYDGRFNNQDNNPSQMNPATPWENPPPVFNNNNNNNNQKNRGRRTGGSRWGGRR